jgi:hypothetical protein
MRYFAGLALLLFCLINCSKNNTDPSTSPRIKSLAMKGTSTPPEYDNIDFSYDNSERITQILGYHGPAGQPIPAADTIFKFVFYYNSADKLPWLVVLSLSYSYMPQTEYTYNYLYYDNQNRVIRDSLYFPDAGISKTLHYTYTSEYTLAENIFGTVDTLRKLSGNYDSFVRPGPLPSDPKQTRYTTFDNGFNPLNYLNISSIYHIVNNSKDPNLPEWSAWSLSNKNNIIKEWINSSVTDPPSSTLEYKYNTHGLPLYRVWRSGLQLDITDTLTYIYDWK